MNEHDRHSLVWPGALHAMCMMRRVAVQIPPSPTVGGVGIVHALLQHWWGFGGAWTFGLNLILGLIMGLI